jgi:hypothetical protein
MEPREYLHSTKENEKKKNINRQWEMYYMGETLKRHSSGATKSKASGSMKT